MELFIDDYFNKIHIVTHTSFSAHQLCVVALLQLLLLVASSAKISKQKLVGACMRVFYMKNFVKK